MRLIDADALFLMCTHSFWYDDDDYNIAKDLIMDAHTIETGKQGKWVYEHFKGMHPAGVDRPDYKCSACGDWTMKHQRNYCPNCGAKMEVNQ